MAATDFLSCDWGTTSFRLRWVSGAEQRIVREIREPSGIKTMIERASAAGARPNRAGVFADFFANKLHQLLGSEMPPHKPVPLVISGMASSSVGWRELPYAAVPFAIDGSSLVAQQLDWKAPPWIDSTHLISGVATGHDMMRGEECEIIGLMSLPVLAQHRSKCLLILPGTHSKHVRIENNRIVDWRTFMTGELFESRTKPLADEQRSAFIEGVRAAQEIGLAAGLFRVRTRAVLRGTHAADNTAFFSGLVIGAEMIELGRSAKGQPIIFAATVGLGDSYACAAEAIDGRSTDWIFAPFTHVESATILAHARFLATKCIA